MGVFSTQLELALKQLKWSQIEVVRRSRGLSATHVSRYVTGSNLPEIGNLELLCEVFPEEFRRRLVTAYLLDHIPPSAAHLVEVRPASSSVSGEGEPLYGKAAEGTEFWEALRFLEQTGLHNKHVKHAVISMVRAFRGDPVDAAPEIDQSPEGRNGVVRESARSNEAIELSADQ